MGARLYSIRPLHRGRPGEEGRALDFTIPDDVRALAARARDLLDSEVVPLESAAFAGGFPAVEAELARIRVKVRDLGLLAPHVPREWGGAGLPLLAFAHLGEVLGRSPLGHYAFNCQAPDAGNMELLLHRGSPDQRERWLRPLVAGELRSCFALTEPELPGSNPTWLATTGREEGGGWVLDGHKWFTSSAEGAAFAVVAAVTDPEAAKRHERASLFLVPSETPGFEIVQNLPVGGERGAGWMSHAEVRLTGVRVPADSLLGPRGAGFALAQERLGPGRIHHCMRWIGVCERAFDLLCERAATRQLAPGELLGERQLVQAWIAESRAEIDAARLLVLATAWRIDREGARAARDEISLIKFHVAGVMQAVLDRAIQAHGALGLTDATPLAFWWRHERGARIYDGPDEVHKTAVARRLLARRAPGRTR